MEFIYARSDLVGKAEEAQDEEASMVSLTFLKEVLLSAKAQNHPKARLWFALSQKHYNQFVKIVRLAKVTNLTADDFLAVSKVLGKLSSSETRHQLAREMLP